MSDLVRTEAIVIKNTRWRDSSKIMHLLTRDKGQVKAIAKGALRPKSPFRGVLENLNCIEVVLSVRESRGLQIITQAYLNNSFSNIRENLDSISVTYAILELIQNFIQYNEMTQKLFDFTKEIFDRLNQKSEIPHMLFFYQFLLFFSEYLGFAWNFNNCHFCKKEVKNFPLSVNTRNGAVICANCSKTTPSSQYHLTENDWKMLFLLKKNSPLNLLLSDIKDNLEFNDRKIYNILITYLNYHTEQHLQLKSLKIYHP
jgi:DNA repair protein RecO (recombination protein O)